MMGKQMIGAVREMSEHIEYIEDVTREDGKLEKMDIEYTKTKRKENLDDSYDIQARLNKFVPFLKCPYLQQ